MTEETGKQILASLASLHGRVGELMGKVETALGILKAREQVYETGTRNTQAVSGSLFEPRSADPRPVTADDPITDEDVPI